MEQPVQALVTIPARAGRAAFVPRGHYVRVINTHGQQVVDTWAFNRDDPGEFMSMEHTRAHTLTVFPSVGHSLLTNYRRPILTFTEDTSGGMHDTLIAACDRFRYELLGCTEPHANCTDNLSSSLASLGLSCDRTPSPLNLFMNIPVDGAGRLSFEAPVSTAGSFVTLRAEMDIAIVFSACPQDLLPINGRGCIPTEAHFEVFA
ncbi:MAG: urea carboxylase-associated family protein [Betaproteobacteria bacterium]|jgi:hypothetical protein